MDEEIPEEDVEETQEKKGNLLVKIIGWVVAIAGFVFLFIKAFGDMTGLVIFEGIAENLPYGYIFGLILVGVGAVLVLVSGKKK